MRSNNLGCFWQLILLAIVMFRTDIVFGDLKSFQPMPTTITSVNTAAAAATTDQIDDEANKQSVDFINSNDVERTTNDIKLQPPPASIRRTTLTTIATTASGIAFGKTTTPSPPPPPPPTITSFELETSVKIPNMGSRSLTVQGTTKKSSPSETSSPPSTLTRTKDSTTLTFTNGRVTTAMPTTSPSTDEFPLKIPTTIRDVRTTAIIGTTTTLSLDYYYEYASTTTKTTRRRQHETTTIGLDDATLQYPPSSDSDSDSDSLTKGFTIPTFLPPVREFAVADLPSYLTTTTTMAPTTTADDLQQNGDQLYFSPNGRRKNLTLQSTNVSVQIGNHAYMPCNIRRIQNKPVSWVRVRDGHILSVDQTTFIADQRFQSIYNEENEHSWSLQIKYVHESDEGWYECQLSTEPKMSSKMYLEVIVPTTELIGDQNRFVKAGSKVALHCIVRGTIVPPTYIIWYREKSQIVEENNMGWYTQIDRNIFGNASDNQNTIGSLIIPFVRKKDSGNYTCQPSNSESVSVDLHVLSGEYSASAIMSAARIYRTDSLILLLIFFLLALQKT